MTREELIKAINDNEERWSCPEYSCDKPDEEDNTGECCLKCAEKQLSEYEKQIREKAFDEIRKACGSDEPNFTNCIGCPLARFENDFETTICKVEQLKGE